MIINYSTSAAGSLRIEILDSLAEPIPGYTLSECDEIYGDQLERTVTWQGKSDLSELQEKIVRLRFVLKDADLFSFTFRKLITNINLVLIRSIFLITAFACAVILSILFCSSFINSNINKGDLNPVKRTIVWDAGENEVDGYRIPGIVVTKSGSVLVFAEERPQYGDADPKSIVLKRSEDSGLTWSENIYIEKSDGKYWSKHNDKIAPNDVTDKKEVWTKIQRLWLI